MALNIIFSRKAVLSFLFLAGSVAAFASRPLVGTREGLRMEYKIYAPDGKAKSSDSYVISSVRIANDTTYIYHTDVGAEENSEELSYYLFGDKLYFAVSDKFADISDELTDKDKESVESVAMEMSGYDFGIPFDIREGDKIPAAELSCKMRIRDSSGDEISIPKITVALSGAVLKPQLITTPAGTFDCTVVKVIAKASVLVFSQTEYSILYFARDIGLVREETVSRKGDITEYKVLERIVES